MIPAVSASRRDGRSSFATLQRYLTVERKFGTSESVLRGKAILSGNLLSLETAAVEMRDVAYENPRVSQPLMHFQLSWKPGETPSESQWLFSAERCIEALGFSQHQYVIVPHEDKEHFHVHVMLNRVHPESAKAHNPRLSLLTLHKVARELEHEFGWSETEGLFRWDKERNQAVRNTRIEMNAIREKSEKSLTETSASGARQDHFRDEPSLKAFASRQPAETLRRLLAGEANWQRVHLALSFHGLTIQKAERGGYTVGVEGAEVRVKASDVFRFAFSGKEARSRTEAALGAFEPFRLGNSFDPPVIDYSRQVTPAQARSDTKAFWANHGYGRGMERVQSPGRLSGAIRSIDDLPRLSDLRQVASIKVDRLSIQEIAHGTPGFRSGVRLVVQPGTQAQTRQNTVAVRSAGPAVVRRQQWLDKEAEAGRQRRQQRTEERARERLELKREFAAVKSEQKAALHTHTVSARARRTKLFDDCRRNKLEIRSLDMTWRTKKIMLSVAVAELLVAKQNLNQKVAEERAAVPGLTYQQWVEQKAEAGDRRAAAQMRGWRYQDSRNLRKIDSRMAEMAGELEAKTMPESRHNSAVDWQALAHERVRQMKDQAAFRKAVEGLRWRADSKTGDVLYTVHGSAALVDRGKKITVLVSERNATRVALQMAIHKYGGVIDAKGTTAWQDHLIAAAVQDNVQVVFTDPKLQQRLRDARQAIRDQVKPTGLDLTRAKQRFQHFDDQLMQRYGPGLDPSKADRLIAGNMARAGSSEAEIASVMRELSRQARKTGQPADEAYCRTASAGAVSQIEQRATEQKGVER